MLPRTKEKKKKPKKAKFASYMTRDRDDKGTFFRDGQRCIDFVIAYEFDTSPSERSLSSEQFRKAFFDSLLDEGLHLEIEICSDSRKTGRQMGFCKVFASWKALCKYAEIMRVRMPIEYFGATARSAALAEELDKLSSDFCGDCFTYDKEAIPDGQDYFSAPFSRPYIKLFAIEHKESFFTESQRIRIVWYILSSARFGPGNLEFGIHRLLAKHVFKAAYPVHDGPATTFTPQKRYITDENQETPKPHNRYLLYKNWASFSQMSKLQPIHLVRDYFGEKIGIYFGWLGEYTEALVYLAIIGSIVFIIGAVTVKNSENVQHICDRTKLGCTIMCPLQGHGGNFWPLHTSCLSAIYTYLCDNFSTIGYAVAISVWGTVFLEMWHRREMVLKYEWDMYDYETREPPRPQFEAKASETRVNPLTGEPEAYEPLSRRICRSLASWSIVAVLIIVVVGTMISIIIYRSVLNSTLARSIVTQPNYQFLETYGRTIVSLSAALINLLVILCMSGVYQWLAFKLTEWERPRTQSDFDESFTMKMFIFQFANCYGTIFYTAFFRGRMTVKDLQSVDSYELRKFVGYVSDQCDPAGCMADLSMQLAIVMIGRQLVGHFTEIGIPYLMKKRHQLKGLFHRKKFQNSVEDDNHEANVVHPVVGNSNAVVPRWEADFYLVDYTPSGVIDEYLEMVLQFGFVTLFGVCFPLSPVFALINNMIEIQMDALKLIMSYRRPIPAMCDGIGIWRDILRWLIWISIVSNSLIIAFTSDSVPLLVYYFSHQHKPHAYDEVPPAINTSAFKPSTFSYTMSVGHRDNITVLGDIKLPDQCTSGVADKLQFGGFALQNLTLISQNASNVEYCYYRGFYQAPWQSHPYDFAIEYWEALSIRLGFALSFVIVVWVLSWIVAYCIPREPKKVQLLQRHEQALHEQALLQADSIFVEEDDDGGDAE